MLLRILFKPPVLMLLALLLASAAGLFYYRSGEIGAGIGSGAGKLTGIAVGSYKGVTEGLEDGFSEGKAAGLDAEDITADITQAVREVGNLQVLAANVEIPDYHEVGKKYAALYLFRGSAVFSVDLTRASVSRTAEGEVIILLPTFRSISMTPKRNCWRNISGSFSTAVPMTGSRPILTRCVRSIRSRRIKFPIMRS